MKNTKREKLIRQVRFVHLVKQNSLCLNPRCGITNIYNWVGRAINVGQPDQNLVRNWWHVDWFDAFFCWLFFLRLSDWLSCGWHHLWSSMRLLYSDCLIDSTIKPSFWKSRSLSIYWRLISLIRKTKSKLTSFPCGDRFSSCCFSFDSWSVSFFSITLDAVQTCNDRGQQRWNQGRSIPIESSSKIKIVSYVSMAFFRLQIE